MTKYREILRLHSRGISGRSIVVSCEHVESVERGRSLFGTWNVIRGRSFSVTIMCSGENERADYGAGLLKALFTQLTADYGKGFTVTNMNYVCQFYLSISNCHAGVCDNLKWIDLFLFACAS